MRMSEATYETLLDEFRAIVAKMEETGCFNIWGRVVDLDALTMRDIAGVQHRSRQRGSSALSDGRSASPRARIHRSQRPLALPGREPQRRSHRDRVAQDRTDPAGRAPLPRPGCGAQSLIGTAIYDRRRSRLIASPGSSLSSMRSRRSVPPGT